MSLAVGAGAWQSGTPSTEAMADEDVARRIARIVAIANALLLLLALLSRVPGISDTPVWWRTASVLLVLASVAVLLSHRAPRTLIRIGWAVYPSLWAVVSIAWTVFGAASVPGSSRIPWSWVLAPLAISIAALRWRLAPAILIGAAPVLLVPLMAVLNGGLTPPIASTTALHLGDLFFAVLIMAARGHLFETWRVSRELADEEQTALREQAWRDERNRLTAIVHDHVLGTLGAAGRGGVDPAQLAVAAQRSVAMLADGAGEAAGSTAGLRAELGAIALANGFEFTASGSPSALRFPAAVGEAVLAAVAQAARNSVEHAGGGPAQVIRRMHARLEPGSVEVEVIDDGDGFDPSAVPESRLGLRTSVLGRMRAVDGGMVSVDSAPSQGTRVKVTWRATESGASTNSPPATLSPAPDLPDIGAVAGVTSIEGRGVLLVCWALGLVWVQLAWPNLPTPGLVVAAAGWLLVALLLISRRSAAAHPVSVLVMTLTPAVAAACLLSQWSHVELDQVWLLQLGSDLVGLLALRGRVRAAVAGIVPMALVVLVLTWRMGDPSAGIGLLVLPVIGLIAGALLNRGLSRTMQANLDYRNAEARARDVAQAAREAAERSGILRAAVARLGLPSLSALAGGQALDERLVDACVVDAHAIRDLLRAPSLATGSLARACAEARRRGVQVSLFDDSEGQHPLSEHNLVQLTEAVDSAGGGRVTIRMLPVGRRPAVTAVLDDDTVRRLELSQ